ncbi:MAG: sodium:proton exchanger [Deltaproteobacteria bacterium]|nr:MAG: sodium:proton exchanger [Deltaproteobacteria bacterium]
MNLFVNGVMLVAGFVFLIKGADMLVDGASSLARTLRISDLAIGLTVVSFGTSTPELFVNITASLAGNNEMAVGNVIGSNIANVLLILGVSAIIMPLSVGRGTIWKAIPFCLLSMVVAMVAANDIFFDQSTVSVFSRSEGITFLLFFIIFLYYTGTIAKDTTVFSPLAPEDTRRVPVSLFLIVIGLLGLKFGGDFVVKGALGLAEIIGISEAVAGLTIVALGTSLPELATSAVAAWRGQVDIAVGNVVGSNIFNIFLVMGISSVIHPIPFDTSLNPDMFIAFFASLLLFIFMFTGIRERVDRWEGGVFLFMYVAYVGYLFLGRVPA